MNRNKEMRKSDHLRGGRFHALAGALVAVFGLFWLTHKFDLLPAAADGSNIVWPILTIAIGLWFAFRRREPKGLSFTEQRR